MDFFRMNELSLAVFFPDFLEACLEETELLGAFVWVSGFSSE